MHWHADGSSGDYEEVRHGDVVVLDDVRYEVTDVDDTGSVITLTLRPVSSGEQCRDRVAGE